MYIHSTSSFRAVVTPSNNDIVEMIAHRVMGDLELFRLQGKLRVAVGNFRDLGFVPDEAQFLSLSSTLNEVAAFVVLKAPGARAVPLECGPSFVMEAKSGEEALVFALAPDTDILDVMYFFIETFNYDKHNYRLSLHLPMLIDGWSLTEDSVAQLQTGRLQTVGFGSFVQHPTLH